MNKQHLIFIKCLLAIGVAFPLLSAASEVLFLKYLNGGGSVNVFQIQKLENGCIILGHKSISDGEYMGYWLVRTDANGDTLWSRFQGGIGEIAGYDLRQTQDSGFVITGVTTADSGQTLDVWLVRIDENGAPLWSRSYSRSEDDEGLAVIETMDGNYIVAGFTMNDEWGRDLWLLKMNSQGDSLSSRIYGFDGEPSQRFLYPQKLEATEAGFIVAGYNQTGGNTFLVAFNTNLDTLWSQVFSGVSTQHLVRTENGYLSYGSHYNDLGHETQIHLVYTDQNGMELQRYSHWFQNSHLNVSTASPRDLMFGGHVTTYSRDDGPVIFVRVDQYGSPMWEFTVQTDLALKPAAIVETGVDTFTVAGYIWDEEMSKDIWLMSFRYDSTEVVFDTTIIDTTIIDTTIIDTTISDSTLTIYFRPDQNKVVQFTPAKYQLYSGHPNPFNASTTIGFDLPAAADITLIVYDLTGREVARLAGGDYQAGYHQVVWDGSNASGGPLPSGIYIARLTTPGYSKSIKMLLLK
ncbi:MAG: T9SS type A sorting domain-containing protein [Candidatus Marinimicrobia bacterium]|nr:T9SS type A sorting domain-containing protein [Candidatus Neomarinimicrobiota bacterium]